MIELLTLGKRHGWERLRQAVDKALALGCTDAAAVGHLLTATELSRPRPELLELNGLERYDRPLPQMNEYDQLLSIAAASTAEVAR
jgi:microcompartment protein CcmL/EutN